MILNVDTPNFCPDNCPNAEIERQTLYTYDDKAYCSKYFCSNEHLCKLLQKQLQKGDK